MKVSFEESISDPYHIYGASVFESTEKFLQGITGKLELTATRLSATTM